MTIKLTKMSPSVVTFDVVWSQDLVNLIGATIYLNQLEYILIDCNIKGNVVFIEYGNPMSCTWAMRLNRDTPIVVKIAGNN
jgi:hypothetical protein